VTSSLLATIGETLRNLEHLWHASTQLDILVSQLMEPMKRWIVTNINEGPKASKEESASSDTRGRGDHT